MGSLPPIGAQTAPCVLAPSPQGEEREGNRKRGRRKRVLRISEQPVILKRKIRLEQDASELLEDYARFIGICAEDVLNIVLKKLIANDMEFQSSLSQQNIQKQGSQSPLGLSACAVETEAA
jgi:hypothetical protein